MEERKLATIRKVKAITPIEGADNIELATVDGWNCVVKKGEFKVDDLGCYFEIDSLLPCNEPFLFLEPRGRKINADGSEGYRIKTMKLRGVISQGLLMPLSRFDGFIFKDVTPNKDYFKYGKEIAILPMPEWPQEGDDVTERLNVKKYEPPIPAQLAGLVKGHFPGFIHKTDEERIQNVPEYFDLYYDDVFEITEKIDGTSCTFYLKDDAFGVCSRNLELKESENNLYWKTARVLNIEDKMRLYKINRNIAIHGEIIGEGVQKNPLKIQGNTFQVFKVFDIDKQTYLPPDVRYSVAQVIGLPHVPIIYGALRVFKEYNTMEKILEFANGKSLINEKCMREGLVFKSYQHPDISFKVISNKYLLKHEE